MEIMEISMTKKYWLSFCQSFGNITAIRTYGNGDNRITEIQMRDDNTGMPHFCRIENFDKLVKERPGEDDSSVYETIEKNRQEMEKAADDGTQLDLFDMLRAGMPGFDD